MTRNKIRWCSQQQKKVLYRRKLQPWVSRISKKKKEKKGLSPNYDILPPPNSLCLSLLMRSWSCEFGLSGKEMPSGRILSSPFTQTDAVGYRVDDRCLKHTLLVKLQPNSSRQLLSWTREEAPACAALTAFPFVLKWVEVSEVLGSYSSRDSG